MKPETNEKLNDSSIESGNGEAAFSVDIDDDPVYSHQQQRAIIHRIDRRLVVTLGLMYCVAHLDRGNLGNASIAGSACFKSPRGRNHLC